MGSHLRHLRRVCRPTGNGLNLIADSQTPDNNTLHTEPRAARFFGNNDFRRGPVNVAVITLDPNMRIRYSILTLLAITLVVALLVVVLSLIHI